jgi:hypothetical protein
MNEPLPRSRGDRYALTALKNKRAELASEVSQIKRQLRHREDLLGHIDATLRLLDPSVDIDAIPNKRIVRRIKLFRQGELGRLIVGALRDAEVPLSTQAITKHILNAGGHGESARSAVMPRVRGNLAYLHRQGKVVKAGSGKEVRWSLA